MTLGCPDDPEEVFVGHTGGGLGHQTYSFHSADGERQATFTWNIDDRHGAADPTELSWAVGSFLVAGLCGVDPGESPDAAGLRSQGVPAIESLQDLTFLG